MAESSWLRAFHLTSASAVIALGIGCATTEFYNEGPGQPSDRATGTVPAGSLGVCKRPNTKRPPIVSQEMWNDAKKCTPRTPREFLRIGYGREEPEDKAADAQMDKILEAVRESTKEEGGNAKFLAMLKQVRDTAMKDPQMKARVSRESSRAEACDFTYLLNTSVKERAKIEPDKPCVAEAYDAKLKTEKCLFDPRAEASWITASWECVTHTGALGEEQSCHRLCAYDDYCARQVSCSVADLDLLLCVMGVCTPEARAGF